MTPASVAPSFRRCHAAPLAALGLALAAASAWAQPADPGLDMRQLGQRWVEAAVPAAVAGAAGPLRMEVVVGELDARLRLAPCARIEPYLPSGVRLWGSARIGLRCAEGAARWNVFVPVTVRAWGPAWVLRYPVAAGTALTEADVERAEVDWAAQPSPVVGEPAQWVGQTAALPLAAGQTLRQAMLRPAQLFPAGAPVRLVVEGSGFAVAADGFAVTPGLQGQITRVRTESGRVLSGVAVDGQTVQVRL